MTANPTPHEGLSEENRALVNSLMEATYSGMEPLKGSHIRISLHTLNTLLNAARAQSMPLVGGEDRRRAVIEALDIMTQPGVRTLEDIADAILSALQALNLDADLSSLRQDAVAPGGDVDAWRPIESAPKDGALIVLFDFTAVQWTGREYSRSQVVRWNDKHDRFETLAGESTGLKDDIAWTHWITAPVPQALFRRNGGAADCVADQKASVEGIPT